MPKNDDAADQDQNLERLDAVVNEIEAHYARLVREAKLNRSTTGSIMTEVAETVMPLLKDFAVRCFAEVLSVRQYIHEHVEPALARVEGGAADDSVLLLDDSSMITTRLLAYRELLDGLLARSVGEDKAKIEGELSEVDKVLARVAEITIDDDDDADPDEPEVGDPEDDEDEDEEPGAGADAN